MSSIFEMGDRVVLHISNPYPRSMLVHCALLFSSSLLLLHQGDAMSTKKMVALDLDGTLLNGDHRLSSGSIEKLRELTHLGVIVCLASGRSGPAMYPLVEELALPAAKSYTVSYNGAVAFEFSKDDTKPRVLFSRPLEKDRVDALISFAEQNGLLAQVYVGDDIFVCCKSPAHEDLCRRYSILTGCSHTYLKDGYGDPVDRSNVAKLLLMTDDPDEVVRAVSNDDAGRHTTIVRGSPPFFVECLHPEVCKGLGLQRLCEKLGVALEDVVAFGDGDNDIEMIRTVGLGIAMKNARHTLKEVADMTTTLDNTQDGVAACLDQLQTDGVLPR